MSIKKFIYSKSYLILATSISCLILYWFTVANPLSRVVIKQQKCEAYLSTASWTTNGKQNVMDVIDEEENIVYNTPYTEEVLILTPFKQSAQFINKFFDNLDRLTYPHHLISLGFLVSDSTDGTIEILRDRADATGQLEHWRRFKQISIYQKDFKFELASNEDRHAFGIQVERRKIMAKSRNTLLSAALTESIDWVLWLDGDVIEYPETIIEELIAQDKDVIVPNCYWHSYNEEGGYDKNNWQETPESWEYQKALDSEAVLVEGYPELKTHRKLMIDMRNENNQTDLFHSIPLDGVGGTCTLIRARVHRDGAVFPAFSYQHQVETEGLAKIAKSLGYEVWGLPNYLVYHYI